MGFLLVPKFLLCNTKIKAQISFEFAVGVWGSSYQQDFPLLSAGLTFLLIFCYFKLERLASYTGNRRKSFLSNDCSYNVKLLFVEAWLYKNFNPDLQVTMDFC